MHTIILLLYIPYRAGGRSKQLGGQLVIVKGFLMEQGLLLIQLKQEGGGNCPRVPLLPTVLLYAGTVQKEKPFYTMANQQWTRCGGYINGRRNLVLMGKPWRFRAQEKVVKM